MENIIERGSTLAPTLAVTEVALPADVHSDLRDRLREFHDAGGRVVAGSDAGVPGVFSGAGLIRELELLVDAGLSPRAARCRDVHSRGRDAGRPHRRDFNRSRR